MNKPNALVVDFFAGSGTTLHAVNLLNVIDGGNRQCIMVTNNEVSEAEAESLRAKGYHPGDNVWEKYGIARYVTWPRTVCSIKGIDVNGKKLSGDYGINREEYYNQKVTIIEENGKKVAKTIYFKKKVAVYPELVGYRMGNGFKTNAAFFKLGFLDKTSIALRRQLSELLPVLWMKAGSHGPCPHLEDEKECMMVLSENRFAILLNEKHFQVFDDEVRKHPEVQTIYIVTDSEAGYREMISGYADKDTYQLYRDYLDNFRINTER